VLGQCYQLGGYQLGGYQLGGYRLGAIASPPHADTPPHTDIMSVLDSFGNTVLTSLHHCNRQNLCITQTRQFVTLMSHLR